MTLQETAQRLVHNRQSCIGYGHGYAFPVLPTSIYAV